MKKLVVFDLDGTLAESKSPVDAEMAGLLRDLLAVAKVAIISGGDWPQFEKQFLSNFPAEDLSGLSLLPTCGTKFFHFEAGWKPLYSEDLGADEKRRIIDALEDAFTRGGFHPEQVWGQVIEDRGSQITMSALGQQAPVAAKAKWDPDFTKRKLLKTFLDETIPDFSVRMGGATSIDVTRQGIDKGYGIRKLRDRLGIAIEEMIFVGDALFPGGNDYAAKEAGVDSIRVRDPEETKRIIETIIACLG
ncbi:HAD-IIB family hydrolase [Labrys monachus]|uniref:phosphomannomutase n=1 Tax=Labrys monachus TaxID=217067 RepID=A0ABU0FNI8_9HYPH|nr:HAD-IIB family hydrolase [Labrys monachus]MDQ0395628.1 HAD superfamily hydrolase (TIGR01484 family) [Labrys monachus]